MSKKKDLPKLVTESKNPPPIRPGSPQEKTGYNPPPVGTRPAKPVITPQPPPKKGNK